MREFDGDIMEYQFQLMFRIPVVLPRTAMKRIFLFSADEDMGEMFGAPLWYLDTPPVMGMRYM